MVRVGFVVVCSSDFHFMFNEVTAERIKLLRAAFPCHKTFDDKYSNDTNRNGS